jgi:hypothetical protein
MLRCSLLRYSHSIDFIFNDDRKCKFSGPAAASITQLHATVHTAIVTGWPLLPSMVYLTHSSHTHFHQQ